MPDYDADYPDMMDPAYIRFAENGSGDFAFGCVTGQIFGAGDTDPLEFDWHGNDEMDEASGDGWAELQPDGVLKGQICSTAATKLTSSPDERLLQQPVRARLDPSLEVFDP